MKEGNIKIDPRDTAASRAVDLDRLYSSIPFKLIFFCLWVLGSLSLILLLASFFYDLEELTGVDFNVGNLLILSGVFLYYLANRSFYYTKLHNLKLYPLEGVLEEIKKNKEENLFKVFSFSLAKATKDLFSSGQKVAPSDLAKAILSSSDMNFILIRLGIGADITSNLKSSSLVSDPLKVMVEALNIAIAEGHNQIEIGDVFISLCREEKYFKDILINLKLTVEDVANVVYWQTKIVRELKSRKDFLNPDHFKLTGGIGRDWAFGWANYLKNFATDLSREIQTYGLDIEIIGHDSEIEQIKEGLLRQNGGNVIVVGEPGVGKKTTILGLIKKASEGKTHSSLDFQHVMKINTETLISGLTSPGELTERIGGVLSDAASAGNVIVFLENIESLLSSGDAGKIDATEVLLPFLESSGMHIVATCDTGNYNRLVASNGALNQRFTRVTVEEPDKKEMIRILEDVVPMLEYQNKCIITYEALKETIAAADKYIVNLPNPEKSINLLDGSTASAASRRQGTIILPKDILEYVSEKYDIPSGGVEKEEKQKLLNLEKIMHSSVIGQSEAIVAIANALRRARTGVSDPKKPIGSFLFLGPTGVGKTETAKSLAKAYFGAEDRMIRFDMSEFQNKEDVYRFIGSNIGGQETLGVLTTSVREHPFSLLLFDEIEKANRDILDLFLQILDEGFITDGSGKKVSFSNAIIIATSNAGANLIRESIQNGVDYERTKKSLLEYLQKENIYRPEFLNRFTSVIAFSPLSQSEIGQVASIMIEKLKANVLKTNSIKLEVSPDVIPVLAAAGYDPQNGARPMQRVLQEKIEDLLAKKILTEELKTGDSYTIGVRELSE